MSTNKTGYVVMQRGMGIFGAGWTVEEALEDARGFLDADTDLSAIPVHRSVYNADVAEVKTFTLIVLPASSELVEAVKISPDAKWQEGPEMVELEK